MGLNTNPACTACPVAGCGAQATENPVIARGRLGMSARERTRVRILACFKNLRTCEAHVGEVRAELENFVSSASDAAIRELLKVQPGSYSARDIARLRGPLVGATEAWRKIPVEAGPWLHQSAKSLRATLSWAAERISLQTAIPQDAVARRGPLDDDKWDAEYAEMRRGVQRVVNVEFLEKESAKAAEQPEQQQAAMV